MEKSSRQRYFQTRILKPLIMEVYSKKLSRSELFNPRTLRSAALSTLYLPESNVNPSQTGKKRV